MGNDIKKRLDGGDFIEFDSEDHLAYIFRSKLSETYIFVFNAKPLFGFKTFKIFLERVNKKLNEYSLKECN